MVAINSINRSPGQSDRGGTILLVEDEEALRRMVRRFLEEEGYTVLEAGNGLEGLAVADRHDGPIHLVVSDVVMPWMSGPQMVTRLFKRRPDLKVLYVSGYTDSTIARQSLPEADGILLPKPFTPRALTLEVRKALAG